MTYAEKQKMKRIIKKVAFWGVVVYLLLNASVGVKDVTVCGNCFSIAFDKWDMMWVDKAIIYVDNEEYVITDIEFVREIAKGTAAAIYYDGCQAIESERRRNDYTRWIELYAGEKRVRRMPWLKAHEYIQVYEADIAHWILFGDTGVGYTTLEWELYEKIYEAIGYDSKTQQPLENVE